MTHTLSGPKPSNMRFVYFIIFAVALLGVVFVGIDYARHRTAQVQVVDNLPPNEAAIVQANNVLEKDPNNVPALINRGFALAAKNQNVDAMHDYDRALELDPKNAIAFNDRCNLNLAMRSFDLAIADCTHSLEFGSPDPTHSLLTRGAAYTAQSKNDLALKDLTDAIQKSPDQALLYVVRGLIYEDIGNLDAAQRDVNKAEDINPSVPFLAVSRGMLKCAKGDYANAIKDLTDAVAQDPMNPVAVIWLHLAKVHMELDDAAEYHSNSIRVTPEVWPGSVAALYDQRGTTEGVLAQAKLNDPSGMGVQTCEANFYLGEFDLMNNDRLNAKSSLHDAIQGCPSIMNTEKQAAIREYRLQGFDPASTLENP